LRRWTTKYPQLANLTMSVNLSVYQLRDPNLVQEISQVLQETKIPARSVILEITESAMIDGADGAIATMNQIRDLGLQLHLDDFGTGYSSLSCLHLFPLNGLKIDRSFVKHVNDRKEYRAVVEAIVGLARKLDMTLIAEGVEASEQVQLLTSMGCDIAQGFFFQHPAGPEAIEQYILAQTAKASRAA
jgi:EAL domain-containing protein (putative c-di-GMP-specific phosphodiesterase class I)